MKIYIDGYKNLHKFEVDIDDNRLNLLFGMSGTGKSSVGEALKREDLDKNKTIGRDKPPVIKIDGIEKELGISIFDIHTVDNLLLTKEVNNIYDVVIDDNNGILQAEKDLQEKLATLSKALEEEKTTYADVAQIVKNIGSPLTSKKELKKNAKIIQLSENVRKAKNNRTLRYIQKMDYNQYQWTLQGKEFVKDNKCPYCEKQISKRRNEKLSKIEEYDQKALLNVGETTSKYKEYFSNFDYTQKKIENLAEQIRTMRAAFDNYSSISDQILRISNAEIKELDKEDLLISEELKEYFPNTYLEAKKLASSMTTVNRTVNIARSRTRKILSKKMGRINLILKSMSIPYKIDAQYANGRIQRYKMYHISDSKMEDRRSSMSFGEKNIVSLIMFVQKCRNENSDLIIIDDPASSFDDYRRNQIYNYISEELKNRTVLLFSHDSIFAKYAVIDKGKGKVLYFENRKDGAVIKEVSKNDFNTFDNYVEERVKESSNYYQKIVNLRMLYEGSNRSLVYGYLSAIIHKYDKSSIVKALARRGYDEQKIIDKMVDKYSWLKNRVPLYDETKKLDDISNWSLLEKAFIIRECFKDDLKNQKLLDAINDYIHINRKLKVCLNPYEYIICGENLKEYIIQKQDKVPGVFNKMILKQEDERANNS